MEHIGKQLDVAARNIEIIGADPITQHGFTMVPNFILENPKLTVGGKMTYAMLLKYAWHNDYCFPGQERLADDMGAGKRSVIRFLQELEREGYIAVVRRGLGKSNLYQLFIHPQKNAKRQAKTGERPAAPHGTA